MHLLIYQTPSDETETLAMRLFPEGASWVQFWQSFRGVCRTRQTRRTLPIR